MRFNISYWWWWWRVHDNNNDDKNYFSDESGLAKASGGLWERLRSVAVLTRRGMSSLTGLWCWWCFYNNWNDSDNLSDYDCYWWQWVRVFLRFILLTSAIRLLGKANVTVLNTLATLQNDYIDSKAIQNISQIKMNSNVCFKGDKEYFLALQSSEENVKGGALCWEVIFFKNRSVAFLNQ